MRLSTVRRAHPTRSKNTGGASEPTKNPKDSASVGSRIEHEHPVVGARPEAAGGGSLDGEAEDDAVEAASDLLPGGAGIGARIDGARGAEIEVRRVGGIDRQRQQLGARRWD